MYYTIFHIYNIQYSTDNIQSQKSEYSDFGFQTFSWTNSEYGGDPY
jgi:hypothetical protein